MDHETAVRDEQRSYIPRSLQLQWHITERCNYRCAHCYQEGYAGPELKLTELLAILEQYKGLLRHWRDEAGGRSVRGHITITGGEPFVHRDFLDLLEVIAGQRSQFSFAILTNGSLIDGDVAARLRKLGPRYVQLSMEGDQATHDRIRGAGSFRGVIRALEHLTGEDIPAFISFTAHRGNFHEFPAVAQLGRRLGAARVWADRLIPCGSGQALEEQMLTPAETEDLFLTMQRERQRKVWWAANKTEVAMHRALQFLVAGGRPYRCAAGDRLVTVLPNGDLVPCRRMPMRVGSLLTEPLAELYYESHAFRALRNRHTIPAGCRGCFYQTLCQGGLRCLSYAVKGDPLGGDPGCWRAAQPVC